MKAEYIDHMGTDLSVVNAARVSFNNLSKWEMVDCGHDDCGPECPGQFKRLKKSDVRLINYLARGCSEEDWTNILCEIAQYEFLEDVEKDVKELMHMATHWVPFTHTAITLRMKAPVPIRTQCFKHKQGFTESEESRRYIKSTPELYTPEIFKSAPKGNIKQGSGSEHVDSARYIESYKSCCQAAIDLYVEMTNNNVCPEQARFVLPQGVHVNWIWSGNLASYARYFNQRTNSHAQEESQNLAKDVGFIIEKLFPVSWKALTT